MYDYMVLRSMRNDMRKLRESERSHQIRLAPKFEEKIRHDDRMVELCKAELEEAETAATELERLRELVEEQQEVIEVLRQAVKEKERKLDQMWNKRRKEEYYRKWIQLEPVVEDEDEDEHEDGTGSSFSPQPRGLMQHFNGVSRDAYESVLLEIEELQIQLMEEQQELRHARSQIRELERALLQETRGSATSRRALSEKLRKAEDREACLIAELTELREQNELLEFRVLELEESPNPRDTPDPADSGIVSPEPIHLYKDHQNIKNRDRAVATVIPYTSTYTNQLLSSDPHKAPLSLQESGIFEEDEVDGVEEEQHMTEQNKQHYSSVEVASQSTQTEAPAGELLQEVQRLQELRARIQERGAKSLPPSSPLSDRKNEVACEAAFDIAPLRERIRELEERISNFEADREVSKQREEELLDENYRLTEKTYWQESELKKLQEKLNEVKLTSDAQTMTEDSVVRQMVQKIESRQCLDEVDKPQEEDPLMTRCQRLYKNVIQNMDRDAATPSGSDDCTSGYGSEAASSIKDQPCLDCSDLWKDCDARIRNLSRTEFCLRQQISSMEQQKNAFFGILREADASWAKLESEYESKQKEMNERLSAQVELNRALFEHLTQLNKAKIAEEEANNVEMMDDEPMDVEDNMVETSKAIATQTDEVEAVPCRCQWTKSLSRSSLSATSTGVIIRTDANRVSTISRTNIKLPTATAGCDEPDTHGLPTSTVSTIKVESLPEVAIEAKEEDETLARAAGGVSITQDQQEQQPEPLVSIDKSSDDKKVSSKPIERRRERNVSFERERFRPIRRHRLRIYQEICV